ncbi:MAG TPA: hybrid sensor histidine kinase/response regulator [Anaerolineae bacterium]|nr:hybrid sensor histidine kinase/response regulator [Anaerolineae bacterium]
MGSNVDYKGQILIVDDKPDNLDVLFAALDQAGFMVYVAEDGQSALDQAERVKPDLILLDVLMPGLDGFETCRRLKSQITTKDIPVIFVTALSETADKLAGFKIGAVDYVTKPLQHDEVLARINSHLDLQRLKNKLIRQNIRLRQEIARRQEVEQALQQQTQELRVRNQELDAFARMVAHDVRSPLTTILGSAELLALDLEASGLYNRGLQAIVYSARQIDRTTQSLLLLAKVEHSEVQLKPLDMAAIIANCQNRLALVISTYQGEISLPPDWPPSLGDATWVEEVWTNYISNALKYGGRPPRLKLGATPQADGYVRFWIRDNGPGLGSEEQAHLFREFSRLGPTTVEGFGLGLSIVKRIVEKLGGQVGVESRPDEGSIFSFTLKSADVAQVNT